ncbi:mono-functional DNA-alkylating methyl methanesulfonate N-term-domain-containing protein [Cokeromyces recurvatus]|uniref:mono-functional DNA-alkylating methyl methanesulfonate N-term-domain-containing protein n=1 Tax=Cokeromyces recurvatus TaxID=90255 RepID=UPI00221FAE5E|nr:mono-functional DNA-alkylating methyl methanesulfonate N-term-domain-containing protein [Cokeromyces recurvatus]KAI7903552.1 mono-functional DNA-alkylating methyl methanesulfonate N-term-domain-containing protein [Cokeromyces recurvatus]
MSYYKYVVTAQKPTAVQFAVKGSFTSSYETNLILGKGTRIEVYTITPDGLKSTIDFSIHGTIIALNLYIPQSRNKASLFLITSRHKYCVLSYDSSQQQIITESSGEIGFPGQPGHETLDAHLTIDPSCRYFATTLYESTVTIIIPEFTKPKEFTVPHVLRKISLRSKEGRRRQDITLQHPSDYINFSLSDKQIVSLAFLQDTSTESTLLILYDDALGRRYLQAFTIDLKNRKLVPGDIVLDHFESDANLLIAMPPTIGGVVLIAGRFIRYLKPNQPPIAIGIRPSIINSFSIMNDEGSRILLGDVEGTLHLLTLTITNNHVDALCVIGLGNISIPSCLVYLDNDVIFVGSIVGDSQLIHVQRTTNAENGEILKVIDEFANLAPITDFCVADLDKQGQTQLIACSGVAQDSSLRIIRNGVGLNELAAIEISGVKGVWALRSSFYNEHDDVLLISFVNQTRLLALRDNTMMQLDTYSCIEFDCRTLIAANVKEDMIIQVTDKSVRLMDANCSSLDLLDEWKPDDHSQITVASVNPSQCVLSIGYGRLVALYIKDRKLHLMGTTQLPNEISCIDISPIQSGHVMESSVAAIGVWQNVGVCLLSLPSLKLIAEERLAGTVMPRSILMAQFENICYLLVALGDGQFYNFKLDTEQGILFDKKRTFLGKLPISLSTFTSNGTTHVFAASDKPSVIHSRNNKLVYSNVNLKEVRCATSFNSLSFPDAVALTTQDSLVIGQMEEIQKLHITKIPTRDTPRRITYQEKSRTFGIITERITSEPYTSTTTTGGFEILDDQSFDVLDRLYFKYFERPLAVTSMTFENDNTEYYILATGKETDEYESKSTGRIIILQVTSERKLRVVSQIKTNGMTDCIKPFQGKLLASVRGMICVYKWENRPGIQSLALVCSQRVPSITECMTTYGDNIITGDMMYSIVHLRYNSKTETLVEVAAHEKLKEILAIEATNENFYVAAEREGHLFVVEKCNEDTLNDEPLLETVSIWHLGDSVRKFRFGSLGMNNADPDRKPEVSSLIFATASGAIGLITDLSIDRFKLLDQMQYNMSKVVKSIGNLSHIDWRSVSIMDRKDQAINFIDGDLIESFLDLTPQQMQAVVDGLYGGRKLDKSVEDLCKVVEELMSAHP